MLSLDLERILKIKEYCEDIERIIARYGQSYETFQADTIYQYSISFCILQMETLWQTIQNDIPILKKFCGEELAKSQEQR